MNEICGNNNNNNNNNNKNSDDIIKFTLTSIMFHIINALLPAASICQFVLCGRSSSRVHRRTVHKMVAVSQNIHAMKIVIFCHVAILNV